MDKLVHYTMENYIPVAETIIEFMEEDPQTVTIHNNVYKFSKSIFRKMLIEFQNLKSILKEDFFVNKIIVCAKRDDKLSKYWKMFGFEKVMPLEHEDQELIYSEMEL